MNFLKTILGEEEKQTEKNSKEIYKLLSPEEVKKAEEKNNNREGIIRRVPNAHLVYKRKTADGTFEELWIYNIDNIKNQGSTRRAILSGTDISPEKNASQDEKQYAETWTAGNVEFLKIFGLPN